MTDRPIDSAASALRRTYDLRLGVNAVSETPLPERESVERICSLVLALLFPGYFTADRIALEHVDLYVKQHLIELETLLVDQCTRAFVYDTRRRGKESSDQLERQVRATVADLLADLSAVRELVVTDVEAAYQNDPSATDREVIVASYPCIEALAAQRFAHCMYRRQVPLIPRMLTEVVHGRTGIDIHPGAAIGESCFIDHGTGVVIGETAVIGKHCVMYQNVGLIAWNPLAKDKDGELQRGQSNKRHPTVEDHVTLYAGATVLGGATVIGHHSVIGGSVWLTHSVEPYSVVTNKDPELNIRTRKDRTG
jgi:serine O-acetyltransferase